MAMRLIQNAQEWLDYTQELSRTAKTTSIDWGTGPEEYPCLVASCQTSPSKFISCYVYLTDAKRLLNCQVPAAQAAAPPVAQVVPPDASRVEYDKHVSALLLTIVEELIKVGITDEARFQGLLVKRLATVDQLHAEDKAVMEELKGTGARVVLPRLFPTDEAV